MTRYQQRYEELEVIGRGNFGVVYLVICKEDGLKYVSKKMVLGALSDREVQNAMQEAELLKQLQHSNIVQYKESFVDQGVLIIIMEYCMVGDLSFHIKNRKKNGEFFTETEIMNWFIQICQALHYCHSLRILHRDIKSSNIYLTGNNTVKIGDFGISRVLEGSVDNAMTVIGTPYYMSPEVCQNSPYSYKSDIWSLGCVVYELATLEYAFKADNLLGLVFKIVSETAEPIPSRYSPELREIVNQMLQKNIQSRPSAAELLSFPFVREHMENFVQTGGQVLCAIRSLNVKRTMTREIEKRKAPQPDETPKQRALRQKLERADREAERHKKAARESLLENQIALQRRRDMLYSTPEDREKRSEMYNNPMTSSGDTIASLAFNDKMSWDKNEDTLNYSDTFTTLGDTVFQNYYDPNDERPIQSRGSYDYSIIDEESDEIAPHNSQEISQMITNYRDSMMINPQIDLDQSPIVKSRQQSSPLDSLRQQAMQVMGQQTFYNVYEFVQNHRRRGTDNNAILNEAKQLYGAQGTNYCMLIDQLLYLESYNQNGIVFK